MDDNTPVRVKDDNQNRLSNIPDRIWFRLDDPIKDGNKAKCFNGPPDKYGYCAYDLVSAKGLCTWFSIAKSINGRYPLWANQLDIWHPNIKPEHQKRWFSLCFFFVLAENRCLVTKFEKDNPIKETSEIFSDNPLCPTNNNSFWSTLIDKEINDISCVSLIKRITDPYHYWDKNFTKGKNIYDDSLKKEAYFKYFDYEPFLSPYSGLIQIKKYAQNHLNVELLNRFDEIDGMKTEIRDKIYEMLVCDLQYFK